MTTRALLIAVIIAAILGVLAGVWLFGLAAG